MPIIYFVGYCSHSEVCQAGKRFFMTENNETEIVILHPRSHDYENNNVNSERISRRCLEAAASWLSEWL
jgi:hypothetical protein